MSKLCSHIFKTVTNNNCSNNDVIYLAWKTMFNHICKYEEECLKHSWEYLTRFEVLEMWWNVVFGVWHTNIIHKCTYLLNWNKTRRKRRLKITTSMPDKIRYPNTISYDLHCLNLISYLWVRKLIEKASASEFLRGIYWALFNVKSKK